MFRQVVQRRSTNRVRLGAVCCFGEPWSRPVSARADTKLAPCMARPNLFSGD